MKKLSILFLGLMLLTSCKKEPKYVFYFIGDGMGAYEVLATQMYNAELKGRIGIEPLCFTQFPVASLVTTYSAFNGVTDSAAAGTALATGHKTKNGALGVVNDTTKVNSIAYWAKANGYKVGISTTVGVNHATPAAFYAHQASRNNYYQIAGDLVASDYDFFAGGDFIDPHNKKSKGEGTESAYDIIEKGGYTIARGYSDFEQKAATTDKIVLFQAEKKGDSLPYSIDQTDEDLSLADITRAGISFLTKDASSKGFFLMVEGGKIDGAGHANDAATEMHEMIDFDNAIKVAYEFYQQHPDETLIVITADHETGGMIVGNGTYSLSLKTLANQKCSAGAFTSKLYDLRKKHQNKVSWDDVQALLKEYFGFWGEVKLTEAEEASLKAIYDQTFQNQKVEMEESLYENNEPMAGEAKRIIDKKSGIGWTSGSHSAGYVPVFAIGVGADAFKGQIDNTEIPVR
ncbi:MAG: alkaline phosphatase, partial [Bacteroidales bacterium]|nr:alkaline phosphatase [Bacteroidales bacterium]